MKNIAIVVLVFALCVLVNCGLIYLGIFGFAASTTLILFSVAGIMSLENHQGQWPWKLWLIFAVCCLYVYTIWFPEWWVATLAGAAIVGRLLYNKDQTVTEYISLVVLYLLAYDISFYVMGDPILEWADAALAVTAFACAYIWGYRTKFWA